MRVVALGASNLTLGLPTLVSAARRRWGADVEVLAALGHARSYGAPSCLLWIRKLPGILESGLWPHLERLPAATTRALITDVGNDILYGQSAAQILAWVEECVNRLRRVTPDIVLTDLPLGSLRPLSRARFLFFRSLFVPECRLSLSHVLDTAEQVGKGLASLATARGLRFFRLQPEWYGFDPIHFRRRHWWQVWDAMLAGDATDGAAAPSKGVSVAEAVRLHCLFPERQWLLGREHSTPQTGLSLKRGGRVWLF